MASQNMFVAVFSMLTCFHCMCGWRCGCGACLGVAELARKAKSGPSSWDPEAEVTLVPFVRTCSVFILYSQVPVPLFLYPQVPSLVLSPFVSAPPPPSPATCKDRPRLDPGDRPPCAGPDGGDAAAAAGGAVRGAHAGPPLPSAFLIGRCG
jgi:hypothetical protein